MSKVTLFLFGTFFAIVLVGLGLLAAWEIPAPTAPVEKVIPDDRLPR